MTIFLCGFMGCGKSTVSKMLAKQLGCPYCDIDTLIVENEGMTIPEIFEKKGEKYFRDAESEMVKKLTGYNGVVACGGGTMLNEKNAEAAKTNGKVIFLDVPFEVCYMRISGDSNRPVASSKTKEELHQLFDERYVKYSNNSTLSVDASGSPMEITKLIVKSIK